MSGTNLAGVRFVEVLYFSWWVPGRNGQQLSQESLLPCGDESRG